MQFAQIYFTSCVAEKSFMILYKANCKKYVHTLLYDHYKLPKSGTKNTIYCLIKYLHRIKYLASSLKCY